MTDFNYKKKKVLVLTSSFPKNISDNTGIFVYELCKNIAGNKDLSVLTPQLPQTISLIMMGNLGIYLLYYSHGRYLLPITPIIFIMFILFFTRNFKYETIIIFIGIVFSFIQYLFELNYLTQKLVVTLTIAFAFFVFIVVKARFKTLSGKVHIIPVLTVSLFSFLTGILYLYTFDQGQIKKALLLGPEGQINKIAYLIQKDDIVYTNENPKLFAFYRNNISLNHEDKYALKSTLARKTSLKVYDTQRTFPLYENNSQCNINRIKDSKIIIFKSRINSFKYNSESCLNYFMSQPGITLTNTYELKNKEVYIFKVI